MGRKGIGKLAGFGIATNMTIETWINNSSIELTLNLNDLKNNPITETKDDVEKSLQGIIGSGIGSPTEFMMTQFQEPKSNFQYSNKSHV